MCSHCVEGTAPGAMLLTYPNLTGSCDGCTDLGGNFVLRSTGELDCCRWARVVGCGCRATGAGGTLKLCHDATDGYVLEYTQQCNWFDTVVEKHVWSVSLGTDKPDCSTIDATLALDSTTGGCSATGTTVRVRSA